MNVAATIELLIVAAFYYKAKYSLQRSETLIVYLELILKKYYICEANVS